MGRQSHASWARCRVTVSHGAPSHPQRRHYWPGSTTRQASTARSRSTRCPMTSRPSPSNRQNVVRSGHLKVGLGMARSFRWPVSEPPSSEDLDLYLRIDAPNRLYTLDCEEPANHFRTTSFPRRAAPIRRAGGSSSRPPAPSASTSIHNPGFECCSLIAITVFVHRTLATPLSPSRSNPPSSGREPWAPQACPAIHVHV